VFLSCSIEDVLNRATIRSFSYVGLDEFPRNDDRSDIGVEDMQIVPSFGWRSSATSEPTSGPATP
jgi:hypothetical protein